MPIHSPLLDSRASREDAPAERPSVFAGTVSRIDASGQVFAKVPRVDPVGAVLLRGVDGGEVAVGDPVWVAFSDAREALAVSLGGGRFVPVEATQGGTIAAPTQANVWTLHSPDPDQGPWRFVISGGSFEGIFDPVMFLGYNVAGSSGKVVSDEPYGSLSFEADYDDGATRDFEMYCQFGSADNAVTIRPWFFKFDRETGTMHRASIVGAPVVLQAPGTDPSNATDAASFSPALTILHGIDASDSTLRVDAGADGAGILALGRDGAPSHLLLAPNAGDANVAALALNSRDIVRFYSFPNGAAGQAIAVGANDNSAAGLFAVGTSDVSVKGLVTRGRAGQTANLFEAQNSAGTPLVAITKDGYFTSVGEAWTAPTLAGTWANFGGGELAAGYRREPAGVVRLQGVVKSGAVPSTIFTLPSGYRPPGSVRFPVIADNVFAYVLVTAAGVVSLQAGTTGYVDLSSIAFPTT